MTDYVVLVDEINTPIGTMEKLAAHNENTPLHRGFSLFLFNPQGKLLLQQRALTKKTWPGVWSNSVCGHPMRDESPIVAAKRRLAFELGIHHAEITMMLPDYRYRCEKDGIVENEFCPVMIAMTNDEPRTNPDEVHATQWISWEEWITKVTTHPHEYSQWCVEETHLLTQDPAFAAFLQKFRQQ